MTDRYFLTILEAERPRQGCQHGWVLERALSSGGIGCLLTTSSSGEETPLMSLHLLIMAPVLSDQGPTLVPSFKQSPPYRPCIQCSHTRPGTSICEWEGDTIQLIPPVAWHP